MKNNFKKSFELVIVHEGGYVDHPKDPGGATKYGLTIGVMKSLGMDIDKDGDVDKDDVKALTYEDVAPVYKKMYWDKVKGDDLPSGLDWAVFDMAINSGPSRAAKLLQGILGVAQDGAIGPMTVKAAKAIDTVELLTKYRDARQKFYKGLKTFDTFGTGWTIRNNETLKQALSMVK